MTPPRKRAESSTPPTAAAVPPGDPNPGADSPPRGDGAAAAPISTRQMRQLHALLRDHGITGDRGVHDYLTVALGRTVESRATLTTTEAAGVIVDLEAAEVSHVATDARLAALRAPFPDEAIGHLPRSTCQACSRSERKRCEEHSWVSRCPTCNSSHTSAAIHITFVGHADVTDRLLTVDPGWSWRPFTPDEVNAVPPAFRNGLWIWLTVLGVSRPGFGDAENGKGAKEAIGDALRNAAMRFGVALELWAKGDRDWMTAEKTGIDQHPDTAPPPQDQPPEAAPYYGPTTEELLASIDAHAVRAGVTYEKITEKWRAAHGGLTINDLDSLSPQQLAPLEASIAAYLLEHPPVAPQPDAAPVGAPL